MICFQVSENGGVRARIPVRVSDRAVTPPNLPDFTLPYGRAFGSVLRFPGAATYRQGITPPQPDKGRLNPVGPGHNRPL